MSAVLPWEIEPALSQPRLVVLARLVADTRNKVFAEADREAGDTNWGLGCRAHERLGHALSRLAESGAHPWLTVSREGLYLMPLIDGVPVRPYRGNADKPGSRHLDALRAEASRAQPKQTTFDFMGPDPDGPWFWLLALSTDTRGLVKRAVYFQANEAGETRNAWDCPLDAPVEEQPAPLPERKRAAPARGATRVLRPVPQPAAPLLSATFDFGPASAGGSRAQEPAALQAV
jgi:hypothetical protein